jgi:hypothetical protein
MSCSAFTITYTGSSPTTITYDSCEPTGGGIIYCNVSLNVSSGDTYYINNISAVTPSTDIIFSINYGTPQNYKFSGICDNTLIYVKGKSPSTPFVSGETYCFSAYSCLNDYIFTGCYKLIEITSADAPGYTQVSWISEPLFSGPSSACTGTCECSVASPCLDQYCISYTDTSYDGIYTYAGTYMGDKYWTGNTTPTYYIYNDGNGWCLSDSLGGSCFLSGKFPCISECPDLCDSFFGIGPCSTTSTTTSPCNVFDFDALFDCEVQPTPTPTPTPSITPTPTLTPTQTNFCYSVSVGATINSFSPTPSPTPTLTPTPSPDVIRPCNFSGDVTFTTIEGGIDCPRSLQFQDCLNGSMYYTTKSVSNPSGGDIIQFMIFKSSVDGLSRCISYIGINNDVIGVNNVILEEGPIGYSNQGDCILCVPDVSPTPTPTVTPTMTPTMTPTPTPTPKSQYYVYRMCRPAGNQNGTPFYKYIYQTLQGPASTPGDVISNEETTITGLKTNVCWEYVGTSLTLPPPPPPPNTYTSYSGNWFTPSSPTIYPDCSHCQAAQVTPL